MDYDPNAKREITLHLAPSDEQIAKYCMYCRHFIFKSHHTIVKILEEESSDFLEPPIVIPCKDCKTMYNLQKII